MSTAQVIFSLLLLVLFTLGCAHQAADNGALRAEVVKLRRELDDLKAEVALLQSTPRDR